MKLHERITELVLKYIETLGGDGQHALAVLVDGIYKIDAYRAYIYDGADISIPLRDLSDTTLTNIFLDYNVRRNLLLSVYGVGGQVVTERNDYRFFEYADIFKVVVTIGDKDWAGFEWMNGDPECMVSFPANCLEMFSQKFWDDLRLWPDFNKEFLIRVLDSHGFRFIP